MDGPSSGVGHLLWIVRRVPSSSGPRHRRDWFLTWPINRFGLYGSLALLIAIQSPLLDFRKISLASQVERTQLDGDHWANFDFGYSRNMLGRPGWLHSTSLIDELGEDDPELVELIKNPPPGIPGTPLAWKTNLTLYPGDLLVPAALLPIIRSESMGSLEQHIFPVQLKNDGSTQFCVSRFNDVRVTCDLHALRRTGGDDESFKAMTPQGWMIRC